MAIRCPNCGATNFIPGMTCKFCDSDFSDAETPRSRSERWERAFRQSEGGASQEDNGLEDTSDWNGVATNRGWKFRLLPILAVIALLLVLTSALLQESANAETEDADTIDDLVKAAEKSKTATRLLQVGIIMLAFVVAGISIEYRPQ